ncbi:MAG: integrase [Ponticaulis sp.]|nr:integrase [Ponticaulis sp.]|tara:strand:- start:1515 stop:2084 length:570 start_codon:yes stop_codon:yes gene_type:complete
MGQAKVLTEQEIKRVLAVIAAKRHSDRNRVAVMLSLLAGMRAGEIAALRFSSVIDRDGEVKTLIRLSPEMTKGSKSRDVLVSQRLQSELKRYVATLSFWKPDLPLIKSQKHTKAFSANTMVQLFNQIYREAGIDGASSHSGRRSFITKLASKGVSARVLQQLAGHSSLATTQRYIDVTDKMLREAVELF